MARFDLVLNNDPFSLEAVDVLNRGRPAPHRAADDPQSPGMYRLRLCRRDGPASAT